MGNCTGGPGFFQDKIFGNPFDMAASGDLELLSKYLRNRPNFNVDSYDEYGDGLVHIACQNNQLEVLMWLVDEAGAKINLRSDQSTKDLPIHIASQSGSFAIVAYILEKDQESTIPINGLGFTALHLASAEGHLQIVELLVHNGADVNAVGSSNWTPVHFAASEGRLDVLAFLAREGAALGPAALDGAAPLHLALLSGLPAVVGFLLGRPGVDVNQQGVDGMAPLHMAALRGDSKSTRLLLEKGKADPLLRCANGLTAAHYAAGNGSTEVVQILADANQSALGITAGKGSSNFSDEAKEGSTHVTAAEGSTPLLLAVTGGHLEVVRMLIETSKASLKVKNVAGDGPLELAAKAGHTAVVSLLLEKGEKIKANELKEDSEFLIGLRSQGFTDIIALLKESGPNMDSSIATSHTNSDGTPAPLFREYSQAIKLFDASRSSKQPEHSPL
mmetsp:Transcript_45544/g.78730  ORF Transcript_45544/g.78730 Transcript_45544/m.78730 type:complete len:446 (+) Transcript_45544:126-1463(+)